MADLKLETLGASDKQTWEMIDGGNGDFFLKNTSLNKYLTAMRGYVGLTASQDKSKTSNQRWKKFGSRLENISYNVCLAYIKLV